MRERCQGTTALDWEAHAVTGTETDLEAILGMFEKDPRTFSPEYQNLSPEQKAMVKLEIALSNFFRAFEGSVRRWERMVYPSMLIMGVLVLSGFYLIYNLTGDMARMSRAVDPQMEQNMLAMSDNIAQLSSNIATMTGEISTLVGVIHAMQSSVANLDGNITGMTASLDMVQKDMALMTPSVVEMNDSMTEMTKQMTHMNQNMGAMNQSMGRMGQDMSRMAHDMNRFTRPESIMMPFMR
ncbi:hypothetical protein [Thioalkalivibrio paradoxus]|uniref:Methyl-accepting chemotaxis protein n=1 Tax=Thioalkalivibrio paradoxus ARh 1 TaxID=713585 RepID=W0DSR2_9GAMM|nr:hypothetical protein [Thioalkalivibrio paradoxus]AHF00024.1 hypothetical protein THITH_06680 [Thioalkalivibrio paradoxus ARh 1]